MPLSIRREPRPGLRPVPRLRFRDGLGGTVAFKRDQLGFLGGGLRRHGDIYGFRTLGMPMVLVNHPDYIRHILVERAGGYDKNAVLFRIVRPVLRDGLIAIGDNDVWWRQRRLMAPHFTPRAVTAFTNNMVDESARMLDRWERRGPGTVLDVTDEIGQLALRIVNRSLFSADVSAAAQSFERAFGAANEILGAFFRFPFPPLNVPIPRHLRLRRAIDDMDRFVSGFITERLHRPVDADTPDLLTLLMHSVDEDDGRRMAVEQLHHEVLNLCIGAYETTTNALSWAFYLIAEHPEVEQRLHAEVDEVLGGRLPSAEDLPRLRYARMIVDETLRIYSPAYQSMRRAREDDEVGGYFIPAGTNILINSYFLHRHRDFWDDPERFDPERFTPERIAARPKQAYLPFGAGQRICIGKHFALAELVLAMTTVARRFRLVRPPGAPPVEPEALITLHPRGGIHLRLEER